MQNILENIQQYNPQLTISKMLSLLDQKGVTLTKSMVQNYVRDGLLPPPLNKRHYTYKHVAALVMISELKSVYDMAHIKAVLQPLMDEHGIPLDTYYNCVKDTNELTTPDENTDSLVLMFYSVDIKDEVLRRIVE